MPNMPWFRFYSEALHDRKIARAVRMSQQPKAIVIGVWLTLLCLANESPERGRLMIADDMWLEEDEILAETGLDPITFGKIIKAFQALNMVTVAAGYEVLNWEKRQYKSDNSSERVAKWRAKNKVTEGVTLQKHYSNALDTEEDTEQNRTDSLRFIPNHLATPAFLNEWGEWQQHHIDKGKPLTPGAIQQQVKNFNEWGEARSIAAMKHSRGNNWAALVEPNSKGNDKLLSAAEHEIMGHIKQYGTRQEPSFNGDTDKVMRSAGGYRKLCQMSQYDAIQAIRNAQKDVKV